MYIIDRKIVNELSIIAAICLFITFEPPAKTQDSVAATDLDRVQKMIELVTIHCAVIV